MSSNILFRVNEKELYTHGMIVAILSDLRMIWIYNRLGCLYAVYYVYYVYLQLRLEILLRDEFLLVLDFVQLFFLFDNIFHILVQLCQCSVI